jgi:hypothetical protein
MQSALIIRQTRTWVEEFVIGFNLCPFAKKPYQLDLIRFELADSKTWQDLLSKLVFELTLLQQTPPSEVETTLVIHPLVLTDFQDYLAFLDRANEVLESLGLSGVIQIASFHPDYQFGGTLPNDASNFTNRSPYPMLHLIRETSVEKAIEFYPGIEEVPERNIRFMERKGTETLKELLRKIKGL